MTDRELMQMAMDALESSRVFVTSREKIKHPEGTEWYDERIKALRARLAQPEPEPVAWLVDDEGLYFDEVEAIKVSCDTVKPLYAASPQREWQGLTDEEIKNTYFTTRADYNDFARAIEAKLKEKNT